MAQKSSRLIYSVKTTRYVCTWKMAHFLRQIKSTQKIIQHDLKFLPVSQLFHDKTPSSCRYLYLKLTEIFDRNDDGPMVRMSDEIPGEMANRNSRFFFQLEFEVFHGLQLPREWSERDFSQSLKSNPCSFSRQHGLQSPGEWSERNFSVFCQILNDTAFNRREMHPSRIKF